MLKQIQNVCKILSRAFTGRNCCIQVTHGSIIVNIYHNESYYLVKSSHYLNVNEWTMETGVMWCFEPKENYCRYYSTCLRVEDEEHFVTSCRVNINERQSLFTKINSKDSTFMHLDNREQFIYFMACKDRQILPWFGKFLLEIWKLISRVFRHNMQVPRDDQLKILCSLIGNAYILLYRVEDMILKYPKTYDM